MSDEGGRGWDGVGCACEGVRPGVVGGGNGRADGVGRMMATSEGEMGGLQWHGGRDRAAGALSGGRGWAWFGAGRAGAGVSRAGQKVDELQRARIR